MKVTLGMYAFPEVATHTQTWIEALQSHAKANGVSETTTLTQTCGWPLVAGQLGDYKVVGVPNYEVQGCQGHLYSSAVIVNASSKVKDVSELKGKTAAINGHGSCSGYLLLSWVLGQELARSIVEVTRK